MCDSINVPITTMSMTSDEQCVLAACQDGMIRLIDVDGGESLLEYKVNIYFLNYILISKDFSCFFRVN